MKTIKNRIIATLLVVRNPVAIWKCGGWHAATWAAQAGWKALKQGVPAAVEEACVEALRGSRSSS